MNEFLSRWAARGATVDPDREAGPLGWLASLCFGISEADGDFLARRLNLPSAWARVLRDTFAIRESLPTLDNPHLLPSELAELLEVGSLDALLVAAALTESTAAAANILRYLRQLRYIKPALTGHDLLQLGIPRGVAVGHALAGLRRARLDMQVNTEEEERLWVRNLLEAESPALMTERTGSPR